MTPRAARAAPPVERGRQPPAGTPLRAGRPDQARLLHRAREPHLRPDPRRRPARRRRPEARRCSARTSRRTRTRWPSASRCSTTSTRTRRRRSTATSGPRRARSPTTSRRTGTRTTAAAGARTTSASTRSPGRSSGFLFDQAEKQGISYFNYGEAIAGVVPLFPDKDRTPEETAARSTRSSRKSDLGAAAAQAGCYPNDASRAATDAAHPGRRCSTRRCRAGALPPARSRASTASDQRFTAQLATDTVPAFNYMVLTNDHTAGTTPGRRTPHAMVADNDLALGQIVDLISHSPIWKQLADPRDRGRLAGRRRPRRRAPDPGARDQPVREARRGGPHALRLPLVHPHARADRSG